MSNLDSTFIEFCVVKLTFLLISCNIVEIATPLTNEYFEISKMEFISLAPPFIMKGTDIFSWIKSKSLNQNRFLYPLYVQMLELFHPLLLPQEILSIRKDSIFKVSTVIFK